jgi:hypothetical protein
MRGAKQWHEDIRAVADATALAIFTFQNINYGRSHATEALRKFQ